MRPGRFFQRLSVDDVVGDVDPRLQSLLTESFSAAEYEWEGASEKSAYHTPESMTSLTQGPVENRYPRTALIGVILFVKVFVGVATKFFPLHHKKYGFFRNLK
jgi:hypothetical protein